jgi:hypothetical protein
MVLFGNVPGFPGFNLWLQPGFLVSEHKGGYVRLHLASIVKALSKIAADDSASVSPIPA